MQKRKGLAAKWSPLESQFYDELVFRCQRGPTGRGQILELTGGKMKKIELSPFKGGGGQLGGNPRWETKGKGVKQMRNSNPRGESGEAFFLRH